MGRKAVGGYHGFEGRVFIAGSELCVTQWGVNEIAEEEDTTNSCSAGFNEFDYGHKHCEVTIEGDFDVTRNLWDNPPDLNVSQKYAAKLYLHAAPGVGNESGPFWDFPSLGITSCQITTPAKGKLHYSISAKSSGAYSQPTGQGASSGA